MELASIVRRYGAAFCARHRLPGVAQRALRAIEDCRTQALGGQVHACQACAAVVYRYPSCRNRHCPKCQTLAKERWLAARRAELLPVPYFHLVFTLPHELNALARGNPRVLYGCLFESVSATLAEFGHNPRWLGGQIAATLVLHTWGQTLSQHLHLHCLIAGGALGENGQWIRPRRGFLFPVRALSKVFRGKFLDRLNQAFHGTELRLAGSTAPLAGVPAQHAFLRALRAKDWVVYAKRPFAGPQQVLDYLGRYTHRVAISNHRLLDCDAGQVRFRYKDYAHGNRHKVMQLEAGEFLRRFCLHVLPTGFMRIRHYGILANRTKGENLAAARAALQIPSPPPQPGAPESLEAFWLRVAQRDIARCPHCNLGPLLPLATLPRPRRALLRPPRPP